MSNLPTGRVVRGNYRQILSMAVDREKYPEGIPVEFKRPNPYNKAVNFRHGCYKTRKEEQNANTRTLPSGAVKPGETIWDNAKLSIIRTEDDEGLELVYIYAYHGLDEIEAVYCPRTGKRLSWQ